MLLAHKIELDPNNAQATKFAKACGCARLAYNWGLTEWKTQYARGLKPSQPALRRLLNSIKEHEFPFMLDVTKNSIQQSLKDLGSAFTHFFRRCNLKKTSQPKIKVGYPTYKKKGHHDSFRVDNGPKTKGAHALELNGKLVNLPKIGWVKMRESLRFSVQIKQATVSKTAGRWFISILVEVLPKVARENQTAIVGVDLGCKELAVLSNGQRVVGPKPHLVYLRRLRKLNKSLSRKVKGSANRNKAKAQLASLHYKIACIRKDALNKLTTWLVRNFSIIVIEDLNVSGMVKNRGLARSVMDQSFYEFRRQLTYKAELYGVGLLLADRWYPSTKTCSDCGAINEMPLDKRRYKCEHCGLDLDRDYNAALNLRNLARSFLDSINACGDSSAGLPIKWLVKLPSMIQEISWQKCQEDLKLLELAVAT